MVLVDSGNRVTRRGFAMESSRLILRDIAAMAYLEESELVRMAGTMAKFLGRPDLREDLKSPAVMRDIRRELLGYLESIADGDAKVMEVRRVLRPDSSGRLDELAVEGDTFPAMVTDALSRHLRGIYPEQIRRCSQCDHVIVTARRPKTGVGGTYCNQACFDRALNARKRYAVSV